jgi:hypothetical protein
MVNHLPHRHSHQGEFRSPACIAALVHRKIWSN